MSHGRKALSDNCLQGEFRIMVPIFCYSSVLSVAEKKNRQSLWFGKEEKKAQSHGIGCFML
jgi:hypothetical protein